jgi:hypothetical protein
LRNQGKPQAATRYVISSCPAMAYNRAEVGMKETENDAMLEPDPVIEAYKKDVDRTLIRENLRLSVEERCEKLMRLQEFAEALRHAAGEADSHDNQP